MTSPPTISVLMPAYNAGRYVAEAVESILGQTFADFEFLIVDDGSTDGTPAILRRYRAEDPRIRLVSRPNTGLGRALNEALGVARGGLGGSCGRACTPPTWRCPTVSPARWSSSATTPRSSASAAISSSSTPTAAT